MTKPNIGIIGAGRLGVTVARQALKAGYEVRIINSRNPESLTLTLKMLLPGAKAVRMQSLIEQSDIIILAIPLNQYNNLSPELFVDKIVVDAMNYWPPTEGHIAEFTDENITSSEYIQQYLRGAKVVKTLNHVAYNELEEHSLPVGSADRRAIALVGDDSDAKMQVGRFINEIGFDAVDLGKLAEGRKFQPDTKLFNARYTADDVNKLAQS